MPLMSRSEVTSGSDEEDKNKYIKYKATGKSATAHDATDEIIDDCNDILTFVQASVVNSL